MEKGRDTLYRSPVNFLRYFLEDTLASNCVALRSYCFLHIEEEKLRKKGEAVLIIRISGFEKKQTEKRRKATIISVGRNLRGSGCI